MGHKRDLPAEEVVTTATSTVEPAPAAVKPAPPPTPAARPQVDFAFLREQVTMEQVLRASGAVRAAARPRPAAPWPLPGARPGRGPRSEPSRSIWARTSSSASTRIVGSRGTCWTSGRRSIACRCTRPPCTWPRPSSCPGTEKRNPSGDPSSPTGGGEIGRLGDSGSDRRVRVTRRVLICKYCISIVDLMIYIDGWAWTERAGSRRGEFGECPRLMLARQSVVATVPSARRGEPGRLPSSRPTALDFHRYIWPVLHFRIDRRYGKSESPRRSPP